MVASPVLYKPLSGGLYGYALVDGIELRLERGGTPPAMSWGSNSKNLPRCRSWLSRRVALPHPALDAAGQPLLAGRYDADASGQIHLTELPAGTWNLTTYCTWSQISTADRPKLVGRREHFASGTVFKLDSPHFDASHSPPRPRPGVATPRPGSGPSAPHVRTRCRARSGSGRSSHGCP